MRGGPSLSFIIINGYEMNLTSAAVNNTKDIKPKKAKNGKLREKPF